MARESLLEAVLRNWPAVLAVLFVSWLVKNRFNHGLNKYPGPFLASLTDWWRFWIVYKRRPEVEHIKLHEKHGDIVRLGPNDLSFSNPAALKTIYGLNKGFIKSQFYPVQQAVANGHRLPSLFSSTDEAFHAQLRRSVNNAFSMSTLIQYEPFVDSTTELFLSQTDKLYAQTGEGCDFSRWLQFYAFDVIGEMTYSKRHGFLEENRDIDGIVKYLGSLFDYVAPIGQIPILDLFLLKNPLYLLAAKYGFVNATFPVARFAQDRMAERYPADKDAESAVPTHSSQPDLLSKFVQAKHDRPEFMTDSLVMTMAVSMAFAGSETTAISLSSVFYFLLKNPRCMRALMDELDGHDRANFFSNSSVVTWAESQSLPYLDACIKESFRLHFGMGARTCIGKNISLLEVYKLVPTVLRRFEVRLEDPEKEWTVHNAWFVRQLNFRTMFHRRETPKSTSTP